MSRENYINVRNTMHSYSRVPLAEGQQHYDQATARSGHRVSIDEVRAEQLPKISNLTDRNNLYLTTDAGNLVVGGQLGKNYTNVIKFIEKGTIKEIPNSNGESFIVVDRSSNAYTGWIDPSDVPTSQTTFAEGYEIILLAEDRVTKISRDYGWDFDTFNGILHFSSAFKPGMTEWKFGTPSIQGFIYIGKHVSDITSGLASTVNTTKEDFNNAMAQCLVIQPYKFSTSLMTKIGDPYQIKHSSTDPVKCEWFQTLTFIVPGYCFDLMSLDDDETILTEMRHLSNGNTQIFMDLPWDVNTEQPIIDYYIDETRQKIPVTGTYKFIASCFLQADGNPVRCNETYDFDLYSNASIPVPPLSTYQYLDNQDIVGVQQPYPLGWYAGTYPGYVPGI